MLHIAGVLEPSELAEIHSLLSSEASWVDGRETAGHLSARVKKNRQLAENSLSSTRAGAIVTAALQRNATFMSAALPARIVPPLFNRYDEDETYGSHIDGAIRHAAGQRIRTDLSATLFLTPPEEYSGGELVIREGSFAQHVRLPAGDLFLYSAGTVHQVAPVTRGTRIASFFWIQSIVRDEVQRNILYELDQSVQQLALDAPDSAMTLALTGHYHNLVRMWADG